MHRIDDWCMIVMREKLMRLIHIIDDWYMIVMLNCNIEVSGFIASCFLKLAISVGFQNELQLGQRSRISNVIVSIDLDSSFGSVICSLQLGPTH